MNFTGITSAKPKEFKKFCIRDYVAEVRKKDWRRCCPFNLWGGSEETNHRAEIIYASLFQQNEDDPVNTQENTEAADSTEVGIHEGQSATSETHTCIISQYTVIHNNLITNNVKDIPSGSSSRKTSDNHCQKGKIICGDTVGAKNNNPCNVVINDAAVNNIHDGRSPFETASIEVNDAPGPSEERITEDVTPLKNDKKHNRNSGGLKHQKFRMLSDIYNERDGSSDDASDSDDKSSDNITLNTFIKDIKRKGVEPSVLKGKGKKPVSAESRGKFSERKEIGRSNDAPSSDNESDFSTETDDDSDEFTLATLKRALRPTSKSRRAYKGKQKTPAAVAPRIVGAKRKTPISEEACGTSSACQLRKIRTAPTPSSVGSEESSPPSDNEIAKLLLSLSNGEVQTKTSSKTAPEEQTLSKGKGKDLCEFAGHVASVAGSGLPQIEYGISVCVINRNPSDFDIEEARTFMRRV